MLTTEEFATAETGSSSSLLNDKVNVHKVEGQLYQTQIAVVDYPMTE
jgi:hypothetical protein